MSDTDRVNIEIFERKTGLVIDTKHGVKLRSFMVYWDLQCNSEDYDYRIID